MEKGNFFYLFFVLTILVIRLVLFLLPAVDIDVIIFGVEIHHIGFGLIAMVIALIIPRYQRLKLFVFAVGAGMVIDELIFVFSGGGGMDNYWSLHSLVGTAVLAVLIFPVRKSIANFLIRKNK